MKNFDWASFTRKTAIKAPLVHIYDAWTKSMEIEKWFLKQAHFFDQNGELKSAADNIESGDTYEWSWYLYEPTEKGQVTEANGVDFLQFTFAGECLVDIKLSQLKEYTIVELTQKNIPTDEVSKRGIRLGCDLGWSFYLLNLKSIYEGGLDLRNKDESLKGLVNN